MPSSSSRPYVPPSTKETKDNMRPSHATPTMRGTNYSAEMNQQRIIKGNLIWSSRHPKSRIVSRAEISMSALLVIFIMFAAFQHRPRSVHDSTQVVLGARFCHARESSTAAWFREQWKYRLLHWRHAEPCRCGLLFEIIFAAMTRLSARVL